MSITGKPATVTYGDSGFALGTSGGSGTGAVTFSVPNNDVISITDDGAVTIRDAGTVTVTAVKAGANNYNEARATLEITVLPRDISNVTVTVTGSITLTGQRNYTGTKTVSFDILKAAPATAHSGGRTTQLSPP